jgi:hypothetical protein
MAESQRHVEPRTAADRTEKGMVRATVPAASQDAQQVRLAAPGEGPCAARDAACLRGGPRSGSKHGV